jgi:alkylation response protein AidB-like acyl-CoA dehydrogenase
MSLAISEDHRELARTASELLSKRDARRGARELLEATKETLPNFWDELVSIGWLGLHLPEEVGGSGFGIEELAIIVEELGRVVAPGPFVPTVTASAFLHLVDSSELSTSYLSALANGELFGGVAASSQLEISNGHGTGSVAAVLGGALAGLFVVPVGADVVLFELSDAVRVEVPKNLDPSRRSARLTLTNAPVTVLAGASTLLRDVSRVLWSAEAIGVARGATEMAAQYAKERVQFGRVIGTYQAIKHHCANMVVAGEMATSAVWDAAKALSGASDQRSYTAAVAAALAAPAADLCANLNTQVHGGIAITWEHDAHLYMRRATTLLSFLVPNSAASDLTDLTRQGVVRGKKIDLPAEAEPLRVEVQAFAASIASLSQRDQRSKLIETGYVMPHWPKPYGRAAGAVEQLVIEQVFDEYAIVRPSYGITAWNILTLIQYATADQLKRWVMPALEQEVVWCQLFSEPNAGSDAAGVQTRATRVDGGWLVNGQKVWTSGAHIAGMGFATVRTNTEVPKHEGITMMAIDMHAPGVEVRPLKMTSGNSEFNEVFFTDVFVADDDVVGPVDGGWTVARATLGNESVSIGGGGGGMSLPATALIGPFDAHRERLYGGAARVGYYAARHQAMGLLNLRAANRAVAGGEPGPEGAMTKLILSEIGHEAVAILTELNGPNVAFMDGDGALSNSMVLMHRGMSIAGGTSEIKRNQIGERILGLPRDPLIK